MTSLSLVSASQKNGEIAKGARSEERRRLPRLSLSSEQFRLERTSGAGSQASKVFSVMDLSTGGMALRMLDREDLASFPVGAELWGTLNLRGRKIEVRARVRHLRQDLVGCEFLDIAAGAPGEWAQALREFLDPAKLGAEMRPIPSSENGTDSGAGPTVWYHGSSGTDLLLLRGTDGQYRKLTLFVLGNFVQWEHERGLSTGRAVPSDASAEQRGLVLLDTFILHADDAPDAGKLSIAKTLILSSNLPQDLKKWCARQLEST